MKKFLLCLCIVFITLFATTAQVTDEKFDVVLKINGEEMIGKVVEMNETDIKFVYKGETLSYTIKKQDILKITFASGRVEIINQPKLPLQTDAAKPAVDAHNKVAILPFGLIVDNMSGSPEMADKIQMDCYNIMSKKAITLQFQDPMTTNALLLKQNITKESIKGYTMDEICRILGVEYVVQGIVSLSKTSASASTSTNSSSKNTSPTTVDSKGNVTSGNSKSSSSTYSTISQNYKTNIVMNVFDEKGAKLFSKDHDSFWQTEDAYKATLEFLAKKSPVYGR